VDQVEIDVEQRRLAVGLGDDVTLPDAVVQALRHPDFSSDSAVKSKVT